MSSGQSGEDPPAAADSTDGLPAWATADMGPFERGEAYVRALTDRLAPSDPAEVAERATDLFHEAYRRDMLDGRGAEPVAAACVYMACRVTGATVQVAPGADDGDPTSADGERRSRPMTAAHLETVAPPVTQDNAVVRTPLLRTANELDRQLGLGLPVRDASMYLPGLLAEFTVPDLVADRARELVERAQAAGLGTTAGRHPEGLAAACLVVAYDLTDHERPFELMDLVEAIKPSVATLRERRQDVRELIG